MTSGRRKRTNTDARNRRPEAYLSDCLSLSSSLYFRTALTVRRSSCSLKWSSSSSSTTILPPPAHQTSPPLPLQPPTHTASTTPLSAPHSSSSTGSTRVQTRLSPQVSTEGSGRGRGTPGGYLGRFVFRREEGDVRVGCTRLLEGLYVVVEGGVWSLSFVVVVAVSPRVRTGRMGEGRVQVINDRDSTFMTEHSF